MQMTSESGTCSFSPRVGDVGRRSTKDQVDCLGETDTTVEQKPLTFESYSVDFSNVGVGFNLVLPLSRVGLLSP